jgi:hypothetical protein
MNVSLFLIVLWAVKVVALPTNITNTTSSGALNNDGLNCVPASWTDIASFFVGNYFAHAATVKLYPGESTLPTLLALVCSLLFPASGLLRGLNGIVRHARFRKKNPKSDYQTAAAAGALCMVVRTKSWRPCAGDKILDVILRGKCKDGKKLKKINHYFTVEPELVSPYCYSTKLTNGQQRRAASD